MLYVFSTMYIKCLSVPNILCCWCFYGTNYAATLSLSHSVTANELWCVQRSASQCWGFGLLVLVLVLLLPLLVLVVCTFASANTITTTSTSTTYIVASTSTTFTNDSASASSSITVAATDSQYGRYHAATRRNSPICHTTGGREHKTCPREKKNLLIRPFSHAGVYILPKN